MDVGTTLTFKGSVNVDVLVNLESEVMRVFTNELPINSNQQEKNNKTRLSVRALAVLYLAAAKGIASSVVACVAVRVGGFCECVWQEGENPQVLETAELNRSHNILNRFRFSFSSFFFPLESLCLVRISA